MKKLLILILCLKIISASAQISIFQDADGESGFKLNQSNSEIIVSAGKTSVSYGFNEFVSGAKQFGYGVNLELEGANGVGNIVQEGVFNPKGSIGGFFVKPIGKKSPRIMLMPHLKFSSSTATTLNPDSLDLGTETQDVFSYEFGISLSRNSDTGNGKPVIWGLTLNFGQQANLGILDPMTFKQNVTVDGTTFFSEKEITGYDLDEYNRVDKLPTFNLNFDYAIFLSNDPNSSNFVMAFHFRHRQLDEDSVGKFGLGFYGSKAGAPKDIIGGINIMYNDLYGTLDNFLNNYRDVSINLVVGFKIGA